MTLATRCRAIALALPAAVLLVVPSAWADSAPELRGATFAKPAVTDRTATLRLRAVDRERLVTGAVVAFAGEGSAGTSSCRTGSAPPAPRPGRTVTLTVAHRFRTTGPRPMLVRLDSAGCEGGGGALLQPFTVTPVAPGQPPQEPEPSGSPVTILGTAPPPDAPAPPPPLPLPDTSEPLPEPSLPLPETSEPLHGAPELPLPDVPLLPRAAAAQARCRGADVIPTRRNAGRIRRATLCLVNVERRARGLRRLRHDRRLSAAARRHSRDMVTRAYFGHVAPDGGDLAKRLTASRWLPRRTDWLAGENLGFGENPLSTPRATVAGWLQSTGHRENMLDRAWRLGGAGIALGVPGTALSGATYTALFAR